MFDEMPSLKPVDIVDRYRSCFGEELEKNSTSENVLLISNFSTSLRKVFNGLGSLAKRSLALADSLEAYTQSLVRASEFFHDY